MSADTPSGTSSRSSSSFPSTPSSGSGSPVGPTARTPAEALRSEGLTEDLGKLRADVASLKDTLASLASQAGGEAVNTMRQVGQSVASQVGTAASGVAEAGSELATSAKEQSKAIAAEVEGFTRRNPFGALAGALFVGIMIGMISRGRR
jgi:ElaB/YqjD/DUF883 family membrane-anchored ribosome-binding protein